MAPYAGVKHEPDLPRHNPRAFQAFQSDMADTLEGIKLLVRPRLILTDLNMTNSTALFEMLVAPLLEGGDEIECK